MRLRDGHLRVLLCILGILFQSGRKPEDPVSQIKGVFLRVDHDKEDPHYTILPAETVFLVCKETNVTVSIEVVLLISEVLRVYHPTLKDALL